MLLEKVSSVLVFFFGVITNGEEEKTNAKWIHIMEEKGKVEDIFIVVIITSDTRHNFISHLYSANNYL